MKTLHVVVYEEKQPPETFTAQSLQFRAGNLSILREDDTWLDIRIDGLTRVDVKGSL